jgi:hypothetical protein
MMVKEYFFNNYGLKMLPQKWTSIHNGSKYKLKIHKTEFLGAHIKKCIPSRHNGCAIQYIPEDYRQFRCWVSNINRSSNDQVYWQSLQAALVEDESNLNLGEKNKYKNSQTTIWDINTQTDPHSAIQLKTGH